MKKFLYFMLLLFMFSLIPSSISQAKTLGNVDCEGVIPCQNSGETLKWKYYSSSGRLVITGSGTIKSSIDTEAEWANIWGKTKTGDTFLYKKYVKTVSHLSTSNPTIKFSKNNPCSMFKNWTTLTTVNITGWVNSGITSYSDMFRGCTSLTTIKTDEKTISDFFKSSSAVTTVSGMFLNTKINSTTANLLFPSGLPNLTAASNCFSGCIKLTSTPKFLIHKNTASKSKSLNLAGACRNCTAITELKLNSASGSYYFYTGATINTTSMYNGCTGLQKIELNQNLKGLNPAKGMFDGCTSLNSIKFGGDGLDQTGLRMPSRNYLHPTATAQWRNIDTNKVISAFEIVKGGSYVPTPSFLMINLVNTRTSNVSRYKLTQASMISGGDRIGGVATSSTGFDSESGFNNLVTKFYADEACTSVFDISSLGLKFEDGDGYKPSTGLLYASVDAGYISIMDKTEITLYYAPQSTKYNIRYMLNEGETNNPDNPYFYSKGDSVTLKPATKNNYTFEGWYLDSGFKYKVTNTDDFNSDLGDKVLYPRFRCSHVQTEIRGFVSPTETASGYSGDTWCLVCDRLISLGVVIEPSSIQLDQSSMVLKKGDKGTLRATYTPKDAELVWSSSNVNVAKVSNFGTVTAVSKGTATITCTLINSDGITCNSASCKVTVTQPVTSIALNRKEMVIKKGAKFRLTATVYPTNASSKTVNWKSSNTSVATVSRSGLVTGLKAGVTTITCTAKDGSGTKTTCRLIVGYPVTKVSLAKSDVTLNVGKACTLKSTVIPSNASIKDVYFKSSDPNIATVTSKGYVRALKKGTVTITCCSKDGNYKKAYCKVTVK